MKAQRTHQALAYAIIGFLIAAMVTPAWSGDSSSLANIADAGQSQAAGGASGQFFDYPPTLTFRDGFETLKNQGVNPGSITCNFAGVSGGVGYYSSPVYTRPAPNSWYSEIRYSLSPKYVVNKGVASVQFSKQYSIKEYQSQISPISGLELYGFYAWVPKHETWVITYQ